MTLHPVRLALLVATLGCALWAGPIPVFGVGDSALADPAAAGEEAARKAEAALAGVKSQMVVVFAARAQLTPALIEGIGKVFPKETIYGCEGYAPLATPTNFADQGHNASHAVALLAIGEGIQALVVHETTKVEGGWLGCGQSLGRQLREAYQPRQGVLLTFGDQHVGATNRDLVKGLREVLGDQLPLVGAAAGQSNAKEIVAGEIVTATNVVILLQGAFEVRSMMRGGGDKAEYLTRTKEAFGTVLPEGQPAPYLTFVFDCGGRRGALSAQQQLAEEFGVMKAAVGESPLFGLYGGGEVGCPALGAPAEGVGYHVSVAALLPSTAPQ